MKIVYVGDNRHRGNFGCRATSTALSQIISEENEIVGRIYGDYTNVDTGELFFLRWIPAWMYKKLAKFKYWEHLKKVLYTVNRFFRRGHYYFSSADFINYDFDKSIKNLIKCIPANPHLKDFDLRQYDFDALVVNGEGSFIFATPPWRECMIESMLMYWAEKMGKKVYFLNGMLSKDPYSDENRKTIELLKPIFSQAEVISVREQYSYKYAQQNFENINLKHYPDALFSWYKMINDDFRITNGKYVMGIQGATDEAFYEFDFSKPYICISGSSAVGNASKNKKEAIDKYSELVNKVKNEFNEYNIFLVEVCEGDAFLNDVSKITNTPIIAIDTPILAVGKILANSRVFISGRYHPAILSSLGGTPCIFMSSNSHKTRSVQELLKYDEIKEYNVLPNEDEINEIIKKAREDIEKGEDLRKRIKERCLKLSEETIKQKELLRSEK